MYAKRTARLNHKQTGFLMRNKKNKKKKMNTWKKELFKKITTNYLKTLEKPGNLAKLSKLKIYKINTIKTLKDTDKFVKAIERTTPGLATLAFTMTRIAVYQISYQSYSLSQEKKKLKKSVKLKNGNQN